MRSPKGTPVLRPEAMPARLVIKNEFNLARVGVEAKMVNK